jgi:hypothetical protein
MLIAGALLTVSCGSGQEPVDTGAQGTGTSDATEPTETTTPPTTLSASPLTPTGAQTLPPPPPPPGGDPAAAVPPDLLEKVRADAAVRAGVEPSTIQVVSAQVQSWNDGSLGCPEPGMSYIQVMTEGYQIIVSAGGQTLDYRTSDRGAMKVCSKR